MSKINVCQRFFAKLKTLAVVCCSNVALILKGVFKIKDYQKSLILQKYPLIITYEQSEALINDYFKLVKLLKPNRDYTSEERKISANIETAIIHPIPNH